MSPINGHNGDVIQKMLARRPKTPSPSNQEANTTMTTTLHAEIVDDNGVTVGTVCGHECRVADHVATTDRNAVNCSACEPDVIGTIDLPARTITDASYETAAWYRTFEHDAQTVKVRARAGTWAVYSIVGRTTREHFPTLYYGVSTGGGRMGDCDEPSTYVVQTYDYLAAAMAEAGGLKLADGFEIEESFFDHPVCCSGSVVDHSQPIGHRYTACGCDVHEDAHGEPTLTERSKNGFLPFGYLPGVKNTKRHIKVVAKGAIV